MKNNTHNKTLMAFPLVVLLAACGGTPKNTPPAPPSDVPYQVTEDYNSGVIRYTVQRGDRLSDIALEFTGLSSNWRDIAAHNNISNPKSLREGSELEIPTSLIPGYERPRPAPIAQTEPLPTNTAPQTSTLAVRRDSAGTQAPVVVSPVSTNRDFELSPIDPQANSESQSYASGGQQIKVNGTYYPKGIYSEPAAYSRLMMRVAPGTLFTVDQQINEWYRIDTAKGTGYIRTSDADIMN